MYIISDESYERVESAVNEVKSVCATEDDYMEWEDVAASAMEFVFDELDEDQLKMTVSAFIEYINDTADEDENMALGIKTAVIRCLREKADSMDMYDKEYYEDDYDENEDSEERGETEPQENPLRAVIREQIRRIEKVKVG